MCKYTYAQPTQAHNIHIHVHMQILISTHAHICSHMHMSVLAQVGLHRQRGDWRLNARGSGELICTLPQASSQGACRYALHELPGNHQGPKGDHVCVNTHFIDLKTEFHRAQDTAFSLE